MCGSSPETRSPAGFTPPILMWVGGVLVSAVPDPWSLHVCDGEKRLRHRLGRLPGPDLRHRAGEYRGAADGRELDQEGGGPDAEQDAVLHLRQPLGRRRKSTPAQRVV